MWPPPPVGADTCDSMRCFVSTLQSAGFSAGASSIGRCYRTNCFTANYLQVCVLSIVLKPCGCCLQAYTTQVACMHCALTNALARTIHSRVVCCVVSCRSAFGTPLTKPWSGIGAHPKAVSFQWLGTLRCEQRGRACPLNVTAADPLRTFLYRNQSCCYGRWCGILCAR